MIKAEWTNKDALDLQPTTCNQLATDLISRQDAIEMMEDGTLAVRVSGAKDVGRVLVMDTDSHIGGGLYYVDKDDEPTGEWIDKGDYAEYSNCGSHSGTQFDGVEPVPRKTKFCPNCGTRMTPYKGGEDE